MKRFQWLGLSGLCALIASIATALEAQEPRAVPSTQSASTGVPEVPIALPLKRPSRCEELEAATVAGA